ncbi:MAG: hypothetical protein PHF30_03070 [Bacilli bacterium]|nr:hypothetical protein [Bacilli bacterium]
MYLKKNNKKTVNIFKFKNRKTLFWVTFLTAILLTASTYAWLSSALNVKINFFQLSVSSNSGLFISLDGIEFSDSVNISMDSIIMDLKETYPDHVNQWSYGLWPVSTNGILSPDDDKFDLFIGDLIRTRVRNPNNNTKKLLNVVKAEEKRANASSYFVAFDIFLKNSSGSPNPDNLFFEENTIIDYQEDTTEEIRDSMSNIMNSLRVGVLKIGSLPHNTPVKEIQNMKCNSNCEMVIYEPNNSIHTLDSIEAAENYGIKLIDGTYIPTYGIIKEGKRLDHINGHSGTGVPLDSEHFAIQNTIKDFSQPIFQVPNAITKARVYIWLEGQDVDSLETYSKGTSLDIIINFVKDLAGYEV